MKAIIFIAVCMSCVFSNAQDVLLKPNVTDVLVYSIGAQVSHSLDLELLPGQHTIKLEGVSGKTVASSCQFSNRDLTIINAKLVRRLNEEEKTQLKDKKEASLKQIEILNKNFENFDAQSASALDNILNFYESKITQLKKEIRQIDVTLAADNDFDGKIYLELLVSTSKKISAKTNLKYVVGGVAWAPKYELNVGAYTDPLEISYIAQIINKSGEDWSNVNAKLSLNSPFDKTGQIPVMDPIYLGGSRQEEEEELEQGLDELKIEGLEYEEYDAPAFSGLIEINEKVSIPSNGGIYAYQVFEEKLNTEYVYFSFPSIEENPYLVARVTNWKNLPLLDGKAVVYKDGNDIGESYLSIAGLPDTLDIPIGQNKEVLVNKVVNSDIANQKISGNKVKTTYAYDYTFSSNNKNKLKLYIFEQVPVSLTKYAEVDILEKSDAKYEENIGFLTWEVSSKEINQNKKISFSYTVEFEGSRRSIFTSNRSSFYRQNYSWMQSKSERKRNVRAKF